MNMKSNSKFMTQRNTETNETQRQKTNLPK